MICLSTYSFAQQKTSEIGMFFGVNNVWGDLTKYDYSKGLGTSVKLFYRLNLSSRIAIKANGSFNKLNFAGNLNDIIITDEKDFVDNKNSLTLNAQLQINFLDYIVRGKRTKLVPYMALGVGITSADYNIYKMTTADGDPIAGKKTALTIPFSLGLDYAISERFAVGLEWNLQKLFTDTLDNIYDPYQLEANSVLHNNDWFSSFGVQISYTLFQGKRKCPGY